MRPIDAEKIPYSFDVVPNADPRKSYFKATADKRDIDKLPTLSPDEVRGVGEWEHQELAPTNWTFCSVCGRQRSKKYKWYYCPNCGARMKGAGDEL